MRGRAGERGFSLVEAMVAMAVLTILMVGLLKVMKAAAQASIKAREQTYAVTASQRLFARLNNIPYPYVFAVDSSSPSFGLAGTFGPVTNQTASYPYLAVLADMESLTDSYKFDRFTLDVEFKVRDLSDVNGDGRTTDLREFTDLNADGYDDYEGVSSTSGLRYLDQNGDGDFRDIYVTGDEITEEPHTRLKEATLKIWKAGRVVYQDSQLISWEKFTGAEGKAAGATLRIVVSTPSNNSAVYALDTAARQDSFDLVLTKSYSESVIVSRADAAQPMRITGQTTPSSNLSWKLSSSTNPTLDTCSADIVGDFDCMATLLTASLDEGLNTLYGQATKTVYYSPWSDVTFIRDINPPQISSATPSGTVTNRQPLIRANLADNPVTSGRAVSGINPSVTRLSSGAAESNHVYDSITGYVTMLDAETGMPPVLSTGSYTLVLEGGDYAAYKARSTWTFILDIGDFTDNSAPSIANKSPIGVSPSDLPTISAKVFDNQSGIILDSVVMTVDGEVAVSSATGNFLASWEPLAQQDGGTLSFTPSAALSSGSHTITVIASHWATSPANKITSEDSWNFNAP